MRYLLCIFLIVSFSKTYCQFSSRIGLGLAGTYVPEYVDFEPQFSFTGSVNMRYQFSERFCVFSGVNYINKRYQYFGSYIDGFGQRPYVIASLSNKVLEVPVILEYRIGRLFLLGAGVFGNGTIRFTSKGYTQVRNTSQEPIQFEHVNKLNGFFDWGPCVKFGLFAPNGIGVDLYVSAGTEVFKTTYDIEVNWVNASLQMAYPLTNLLGKKEAKS
jgi:hypothetical protein